MTTYKVGDIFERSDNQGGAYYSMLAYTRPVHLGLITIVPSGTYFQGGIWRMGQGVRCGVECAGGTLNDEGFKELTGGNRNRPFNKVSGKITFEKSEPTFSVGDVFQGQSDRYMLVGTSRLGIGLLRLSTWRMTGTVIEVSNPNSVTMEQLRHIVDWADKLELVERL